MHKVGVWEEPLENRTDDPEICLLTFGDPLSKRLERVVVNWGNRRGVATTHSRPPFHSQIYHFDRGEAGQRKGTWLGSSWAGWYGSCFFACAGGFGYSLACSCDPLSLASWHSYSPSLKALFSRLQTKASVGRTTLRVWYWWKPIFLNQTAFYGMEVGHD